MGWPVGHPELAKQSSRLPASQSQAPPAKGHGRGKADRSDRNLRGVPIIGHGSGAVSGTAPGGELGAGARLERAGRDIVRARLHRNRFKSAT